MRFPTSPASAGTTALPTLPFMPALARDLRMAALVSVLAALMIVLTNGQPEELHEQLVYSLCIAMPGFAVVDIARLHWRMQRAGRTVRWLALVGLMLAIAPIAHYTGLQIGGAILGHKAPALAAYPTLGRLSMAGFTFFGLATMVLLAVHRERLQRIEAEHHAQRLRAETIERQAVQAQLRLLQAQIEPHMLFNTLANLQGLIALDPDRANTMLDQLIQYLRATLGATRAESTTLGEEFAAMEAYLGLMGVRMGERLAYRLELPPSLRGVRLPPLLLQPLVENAIVHGLEPKIEGGEVRVTAEARGDMLELRVADTGLGLDASIAQAGDGVGLATTRERLRALYGARAQVVLAPARPPGALVRLTLPLETA